MQLRSCLLSWSMTLGLALASIGSLAAAPSPAESLLAQPRPLVIGHRGFPALAPENTLPSFRAALTAAVDLVELDYHHSQDGVPIVMHDFTLDRTTDATQKWHSAKILLAAKTAAELRTLDAGAWFGPQFAKTAVPTLAEALDCIQAGGMTLIEHKSGEATACVQLLRDRGLVNRLIVQSFHWEYLRAYHELEPSQVLGALGPPGTRDGKKLTDAEKVLSPQWINEAQATGAKVVVWNQAVTRESVAFAHQHGMKVWIYTINDAPVAKALLDLGIDGIISNNPALIWRALALRQTSAQGETTR